VAEYLLLNGPRQGWLGTFLDHFLAIPLLGIIIKRSQRRRRKRFRALLASQPSLRAGVEAHELGRQFQEVLSRHLSLSPQVISHPPLAGLPQTPRIRCSVIINTVDRADHLSLTLSDLKKQWRADLDELIIVLGPTSDDTRVRIAESGFDCQVIDCPEHNLAISRNLGLQAAGGEFVAFLDDDASPCGNWLEALLDPLVKCHQIGASAGFAMDGEGRRFQTRYVVSDRLGCSSWHDVEDDALRNIARNGADRNYLTATGCNMAFRRDRILAFGGFDPFYTYFLEETDLILRLHEAGYPCKVAPNSVVRHRLGSSPTRNPDAAMAGRRVIIRSQIHFANKFGRGFYQPNEIDACIWQRILGELELIAWKYPERAAPLQVAYMQGVIEDLKSQQIS
jgi:GT2 family glycosyltransferase